MSHIHDVFPRHLRKEWELILALCNNWSLFGLTAVEDMWVGNAVEFVRKAEQYRMGVWMLEELEGHFFIKHRFCLDELVQRLPQPDRDGLDLSLLKILSASGMRRLMKQKYWVVRCDIQRRLELVEPGFCNRMDSQEVRPPPSPTIRNMVGGLFEPSPARISALSHLTLPPARPRLALPAVPLRRPTLAIDTTFPNDRRLPSLVATDRPGLRAESSPASSQALAKKRPAEALASMSIQGYARHALPGSSCHPDFPRSIALPCHPRIPDLTTSTPASHPQISDRGEKRIRSDILHPDEPASSSTPPLPILSLPPANTPSATEVAQAAQGGGSSSGRSVGRRAKEQGRNLQRSSRGKVLTSSTRYTRSMARNKYRAHSEEV